MSRDFEGIEYGVKVTDINSDDGVVVGLSGTGAPLGTSGATAEAGIGSTFSNRSNGDQYKKIADTNSAADWVRSDEGGVQLDELKWRNEKVRFATDDTLAAGSVDITALSDNDDMVYGDLAVGEYCIGDRDGTPLLFEITALPGSPNITIAAAAQPLADNDTYIVQQYLPDPSGQEAQAIVHFPLASGPGVKIGDVNWNFADGIGMAPTFTPVNGTVTNADTVNSAIEKLVGNQDDMLTAIGLAKGDVDMGNYTGGIISDNVVQTVVNQELENAIEDISQKLSGTVAQSTPTNVDSVLVDDCQTVTWVVTARDISNPDRVRRMEVQAIHNGHGAADATTSKESVNEKLNIGNVNLQLNTVLTGAAGTQAINLEVNTSEAGGIQYTVERMNCLELAG